MAVHITFLIVYICMMVLSVQGFIEVGVYSRLEITQSFNHSTEISGWKDTGSQGLDSHNALNEGAAFDSRFTAPLIGVYYVSTILLIERRENTPFKIMLVVNHNLNYKTGLTGFQSYNKSATVSGLLQLFIGDTVSVYVECENGSHWTVLSRSTFFVQLVRSMTNYPAFQASLSRDITISSSSWLRLEDWNARSSSNFQILSGFSQSLGTYCASFNGIYQIHGNILLDLAPSINGSVALFLNDQVILAQSYLGGWKYATASPGGIFKLKKGDCLTLKGRSLQGSYKIQERSGFSALFLATDTCAKLLHAASYRLSAPVPNMTAAGLYTIGSWSANPSPFFETSSVVLVNGRTYQAQIEGQYLINAQINTRATSWVQAESLQLLVIVDYTSSSVQSAASIVTRETIYSVNSLALTGVLYLKKGQTITPCIYKDGDSPVSITTNARFSVAMVPKDWPGVSATLKDNQVISNAGWNEIKNWKIGDLAEGSFSFDGAFNTITGRYTTPLEGTYIASCTVSLNGTVRSPLEMMIAVDGKVGTTTGLYAYQVPFKDYITLSTSGLIRLLPGQYLSVFIGIQSGTSWTVKATSVFSVALNGAGKPDEHGFIGVQTQKTDYTSVNIWEEIKGWEQRDNIHQSQNRWNPAKSRYTPIEEGLYYVSVNLIISHSIASSFHTMVAGDGTTSTFSSCQNYLSATSTNSKFSFTASCSVKLSSSHYVSVFVKSISGGSWSVLGNSSISISLISPISNPRRAGYNSVTITSDDNLTTFKFLLSLYKTFYYGSRYIENIPLIDDPSIPELYISVKESGLYYVGVALIFKQTTSPGFPEYRIALCNADSPKTVPFTMLATKNAEGPTDMSIFGFTAFAVVYLTKGMHVHVCHSGRGMWYQVLENSGFSLVKIVPRDMNPGLHQTGVASVKDIASRDWTVVSDWRTRADSSLYRFNIMNAYGQESVNVSQGTYLFTSSLSITDILSAPVSMCIGEQKCSQCYLHSSIHRGGLSLSVLVRLPSQESIVTCVRHKSLTVTRSAQLLPQANANTSLFFRHPSLDFTSSGLKTLSSWSSDVGRSIKNINVAQGLYFIAINIVLRSTIDTVLKVTVNLDVEGVSKVVLGLHGVSWAQANHPVPFGLTSLVRISVKSSLDITVHSDSSSSWKTEDNATLSLALLTRDPTHSGFAVKRPFDSLLSLTPTWLYMGDWIEEEIGLKSPLSVARSGRYIVDENGIYVVVSTLFVAVEVPRGKECIIEMVISIDGLVDRSSLKTLQVIQGQDTRRTLTLSIASSVRLYKWQAVFPMIRTGVPVDNVNILPDSIFYVALIDKELYYSKLNDSLVPYITVHPVSYVRVAAEACQSITLLCEAQSDSPIRYEWLKDGQFYKVVQNIVISNARLSDAGRYVCVVKSSNVSLTSSYSTVEVFATSPVFSPSQFNVSINESFSNQRLLDLHVIAVAGNSERANVSFTIFAGNVNDTFKVSPSVSTNVTTLFTTSPLDYEQQHTYVLSIMATNTNTRQFSVAHVTVHVLDINDNYPVFSSQSYSTSVPEGAWIGAAVVQVAAGDKDSGSNGKIQYDIESGNDDSAFAINSEGLITVNMSLDYEHHKRFNLTISARDFGKPSLMTSTYVIISVTDTNDIDPAFSRSTYSFAIAENSPVNTSLGRVNATDSDEGNNGRIIYSIQDVQMRQIFSIDQTSGEIILLQSPDYEVNKTFYFVVIATDQGSPLRFGAALVGVLILDVNDNPPVFTSNRYSADITELTLVGTNILCVRTEDKDSEVNSNVTYNITSGDEEEVFSISDTGIVNLVKALDRENVSQYNLTVEAYNKDAPSLMPRAACSVVINVEDANDHPPQFNTSIYQTSIPENAIIGYQVLEVYATDQDSGSNAKITYALDTTCSSSLVNHTFEINKTTGVIVLANQIDRDNLTDESLRLRIIANDGGSPPLVSHVDVFVMVTDINDNPPIFDKPNYNPPPFSPSVDEDKVLVTVKATDKDIGNNSVFYYGVELLNSTEGCEGTTFRIDSNGNIYNNQKMKGGCHYTLVVKATDRGEPALSGTTTVRISVETTEKVPPPEKSTSVSAVALSIIVIMGILLVVLIVIVAFIVYKFRRRYEYPMVSSNNTMKSQETTQL